MCFHVFNEGVPGDDILDAMVQEWPFTGQRLEPQLMGQPTGVFPNLLYDPGGTRALRRAPAVSSLRDGA